MTPDTQMWRQQAAWLDGELDKQREINQRLRDEIERLNATAWQPFEITAYTADCAEGCTGVTATGIDVTQRSHYEGKRVIAADPSVLPMWSTVELRFADGRVEQAIAIDKGGAIKGRKLDYLIGSHSAAVRFGRQKVDVKIIERGAK
ncbi:3D domain-containing protein [Cytobacillus solani]|uniref:3D domain-containing protein n=1 Tax=Cytobacillus solani TaxID=1637975 RepID=UPI001FE1A25F|nr:3D domain-containing protein [Cytobacillus solani]